ncbi:hypothetical protein, partial [Sulfitobacter geojensis]|uniref:hypothetical protein n=1 Tax=Sulfitobacter geojensis TaxID=1342299 RepID=UPI003F5CCB33
TNTGTLTLGTGNAGYTGGFAISNAGIIEGGADAFGNGTGDIALTDGTLNVTATSALAHDITVGAGGGTLATDDGVTATLTGAITATGGGLTFGNGTDTSEFALNNTAASS